MNEKRSLFFPMFLIAAGVVWLLINFGYIPAGNLWALTRVWPFILIGAGLGLLLRPRWPLAGAAMPALVVIAMMAAVIFAPQLGWAGSPNWGPNLHFGGGLPGSGILQTVTREVDGVSALVIRYPAQVTFVQGAGGQVRITADDNLLEQLDTRVQGNTLVIESNQTRWNQRVSPSQTVQIEVTLPNLERLHLDTAGYISIAGLQGDSLELTVDGAGKVELLDLQLQDLQISLQGAGALDASGAVSHLSLRVDGVGSFNGEALQAQTADVTLSGVGSATVRAAQTLDARIDGLGSISYYGSPQVRQETDGLGSIRRAGD